MLLKTTYYSSIAVICFVISAAILQQFISIEFVGSEITSAYEQIRFYGVPIAVLFTLTGTIHQKDKFSAIFLKVLLTLFIFGFSIFIMTMTLFAGMCAWTTDKVLFQNKENSNVKIVARNYGCGATDSGRPLYKLFKTREITSCLIYISEIDTNSIIEEEWARK